MPRDREKLLTQLAPRERIPLRRGPHLSGRVRIPQASRVAPMIPAKPKRDDQLKRMAEQAFEAHAALMHRQAQDPQLRTNPYWQALCDTALARAKAAMEAM